MCDVAEFEGHVVMHLRTKFLQSPGLFILMIVWPSPCVRGKFKLLLPRQPRCRRCIRRGPATPATFETPPRPLTSMRRIDKEVDATARHHRQPRPIRGAVVCTAFVAAQSRISPSPMAHMNPHCSPGHVRSIAAYKLFFYVHGSNHGNCRCYVVRGSKSKYENYYVVLCTLQSFGSVLQPCDFFTDEGNNRSGVKLFRCCNPTIHDTFFFFFFFYNLVYCP